jgi:NAD(P)H-nitrite reductase large subunit
MRPLWRRLIGDLRPLGVSAPPYGPAESAVALGKIPVIDVGTARLLRGGQIRVRGEIDRYSADGVVFKDGRKERFDAVVLATGFRPALDFFLSEANKVTDERGYPVAHGRRTALPGLYFCGFHIVSTGLLREIGREAQLIARDIAQSLSAAG